LWKHAILCSNQAHARYADAGELVDLIKVVSRADAFLKSQATNPSKTLGYLIVSSSSNAAEADTNYTKTFQSQGRQRVKVIGKSVGRNKVALGQLIAPSITPQMAEMWIKHSQFFQACVPNASLSTEN
jgi:hypothetical protein